MLQISSGRLFRPDVPLNEHTHRRTVHTNASFPGVAKVELPVGVVTGSTDVSPISTAFLEVVERLEAVRLDGTNEFMVATSGDELIDDLAYVMTFAMNLTFSRDYDVVHRLIPLAIGTGPRRGATGLFPGLFDPLQAVQPEQTDDLRQFMDDLISLTREDFKRVCASSGTQSMPPGVQSMTQPARTPTWS